MNFQRMHNLSSLRLALGAAAVLSFGTPALQAAAAVTTNTPVATPAGVEAQAAAIPQSVFQVPKSPSEGRDPFFPDSPRPYGTAVTRTNPTTGVINFALKGLAGQAGARFATISAGGPTGTTRSINLTAGQEDEIATPTGRVHVRCLEIKEDSVVIEVGGARRELRLRTGF